MEKNPLDQLCDFMRDCRINKHGDATQIPTHTITFAPFGAY